MQILIQEELKKLTQEHEKPCVSMYLSTHRLSQEFNKDRIRLKNLLKEAEKQLISNGMRKPEAEELLEPIGKLDQDFDFWQTQRDGLAIFRSPDFFQVYKLPQNFEELEVVSDRFHVKPLLSMLNWDGTFYVLALSQNENRLFRASRFHIEKLDLEEVPESLAQALRYDVHEKHVQFHTGTSDRGRGNRSAVFHGQGTGVDDNKKNIRIYLRSLASGLDDFLKGKKAPLVLAAVEFLHPIFQEVSNYSFLMEEPITGNPEKMSSEELHKKALNIVEPYFTKEKDRAREKYEQLSNTEKTSNKIEELVPASKFARVEELFVPLNVHQWGVFDQEKNKVVLHDKPMPGNEDLLDRIAVETITHGGRVFALNPDEIPMKEKVAAVLRF